jgi:hypothetical protein
MRELAGAILAGRQFVSLEPTTAEVFYEIKISVLEEVFVVDYPIRTRTRNWFYRVLRPVR